jgi:multiple sugar transport system substrate-binding protein
MMKKTRRIGAAALLAAAAVALTACSSGGSGSGGDAKTIKVVYSDADSAALVSWFKDVTKQYETANPDIKVELQAIKGPVNDYYTKLALMNSNPSTAPDVIYEDSFQLKSDAEAGYLLPLDKDLSGWDDWSQYSDAVKQAGEGTDGKIYGVSVGTDARLLWYNKQIFQQAGLPVPWQPKTWQDVIDAATAVKQKVPGVTPLNVYAGTANGEGTTMQGFLMLDYGVKGGGLTDASGKWRDGTGAFTDSLQFVHDVYSQGLAYGPEVTSSSNYSTQVRNVDLPAGKLAIDLDGSYVPQNWGPAAAKPWADWTTVMGVAAMPTQDGQAPGQITMSGGWTLALGAKTKNEKAAFDYLSLALDKENSTKLAVDYSLVPARSDVASDPSYTASNPDAEFFASLVKNTNFRPATSTYAQVSAQIQTATESVITGQQSVKQAVQAFDSALPGLVGADHIVKGH